MKLTSIPRKVVRGLPYLAKEMRAIISDRTPFFIAVPRTVHIWRGAPCNAKCIMCDYGFKKGADYKALVSSDFTDEMMPKVLPQIAELCGSGTLVSYMGGEPTISRGIIDWVKQASSLGIDFRFTTNGYKMDEPTAAKFVEAGIFNIGVSLESLNPEINEFIRPYPDGTAKTVQAIENILRERDRQRRPVSVNVKTVLTDMNLECFLDIAKRFGKIDGVMCTPQMYEPLAGTPPETVERLYVKDLGRLKRVLDEIRALKEQGYTIHATEQALQEFYKLYSEDKDKKSQMHNKELEMDPSAPMCNIGTDNMWINNGRVELCPYHPPIGNVVTDTATLKEMYYSELTRRVRQGTRDCRRLCTISCLRRTPITHKVRTFMKLA